MMEVNDLLQEFSFLRVIEVDIFIGKEIMHRSVFLPLIKEYQLERKEKKRKIHTTTMKTKERRRRREWIYELDDEAVDYSSHLF